ncbi:CHRD domain-containing protein [Rheinheimera sp. UJ51]|uniref:CHRD domain-containing protein n=1 Tax=Rheinheimera sp. UJ51 TaxID=2892446 RepID=UPI001E5E9039|nr:CHRD domain-containing protein [Rheinheimera sp. UJ51]MCC5450597.1 CHRD domain-containing protein [Rheinheimera sp. UJ51]
MKKLICFSVIGLLLMGCNDNDNDKVEVPPPPVFTVSQTFNAALSGDQQVPRTPSTAMATGTVEIDENLMQVRASINLTNIANVQAVHIHDGDLGLNGPVAFSFTDGNNDGIYQLAETTISADLMTDLKDGDWYINVHTSAYPDGEIRGQIVNDQTVIVTFPLSGMQQVPAVASAGMGYAYAAVDQTDFEVNLTVRTSGVADATMAHIHTGRIGMNGGVLAALAQLSDDPNVWVLADNTLLDAPTFAVLASGGHYVNVHTPANPSGELRGQILTDDFVLATFPLSGAQEVPAVATQASGNGYALVNTTNYAVEVVAVTSGVNDATMAHIHTGRVGNNGSVLVALEQADGEVGVWVTPENTAINAEIFAVLASGGHYVNVHTPANPSGELRGQILTDNFALATFKLSGAQEVPRVTTTASGDGYALVNTTDYSVEVVAVTQGVNDATMAHIHTGRVGNNGPVLVALEQDQTNLGKWSTSAETEINADIFAVLASGGHYVNVHTPANPGGELRGQILTDNFVLATFNLSGAQEVPAVTTTATGQGYALVNTSNFNLELVALTQGADAATMAHIHTGRIGQNGSVLVALERATDNAGKWSTPADTVINAEILAVLAAGGHYVNIHTPTNPGGELRGQIIRASDYALVTFPLSGAQEVPAVTTMARGDGYALVRLQDFNVELQVLTSGVADATMAHIHTGVRGSNGPVLVALEQNTADVNRWQTSAGTNLNAAIFAVLASGGHYVNIHTPAFPSGEIRGQIE